MLSIDRILWPTDLSQGAERAFPHAAALANWHDAALHALHVREDASPAPENFPLSLRALEEAVGATGAPPPSFDLDGLDLRQEQRMGSVPAEKIGAYVDQQEVDLVVMGTHGRRGLRRLLVGSVAEEVLRTVPCPVLTVRRGKDGPSAWNVRHILAPVDFSEASTQAVRHTGELALTYDARVTLLHAVEEAMYPSAYGLEMADAPGAEVLDRVENTLTDLAQEAVRRGNVAVDAVVGHAPSTILDYARSNDVDLIVIATHGRSGLERLLLGSVMERVVRRASVPVFVVTSFGRSLLPDDAAPTTEE